MRRSSSWLVACSIGFLVAVPTVLIIYKLYWHDYSVVNVLPQTRYRVTYDIRLDGHDDGARVRAFLPSSDRRQNIADDQMDAPAFHASKRTDGLEREVVWSGSAVPDLSRIQYSFSVDLSAERYDIDPAIEVPPYYPMAVASYLRAESDIQIDDPAIVATLQRIGADRGPIASRLRAIFDLVAGMPVKAHEATVDAASVLALGMSNDKGKSRLFVALVRASGIPARLVGGLALKPGRQRSFQQWAEVYIAGHWVPFCPTNKHFAALPDDYLTIHRGGEPIFAYTADTNFDASFRVTASIVPSSRALASFRMLNVWALFERLGFPFSLLRTVLMLPVGALIVVLFRNVVGMPTFGTFLPALIAAAAGETGVLWGVVGLFVIMAVVAAMRWITQRMELLHSPTLAILLAVVVMTMLGISLVAERLGMGSLTRISYFPIAVVAIAAERFYLSITDSSMLKACKLLAGTLVVVLGCHVVMNSMALQVLLSGFPEILLYVIAANIYLGRWVGVRVFEYLRFRPIFLARRAA